MSPGRRSISRAILLAVLLTLPACGSEQRTTNQVTPSDTLVLARIGEERVTMADVRGAIGDRLDRIDVADRRSRLALTDTVVRALVRERLVNDELRRHGTTVDALLAAESRVPLEPTADDVAAWYRDRPPRLARQSLDSLRDAIVAHLRAERVEVAGRRLERRLYRERKVRLEYEPYREELLDVSGSPTLGPARAPVTLVEFSDFQCPSCARLVPVLKRLRLAYGDSLRIVYRHFPLASHPDAPGAAEASLCAFEQGRFWEMHDALFGDQGALGKSELQATARRLRLDGGRFDECLATGRFAQQVRAEAEEARRLGLRGTPSLFVNGRPVPPGTRFETIAAIIDDELMRLP